MKYFIYAEDFAAGLIGPFENPAAATEHVAFLEVRGDADSGRVIDEKEAEALRQQDKIDIEMTPEKDRAFVWPD